MNVLMIYYYYMDMQKNIYYNNKIGEKRYSSFIK